MHYLKHYAPLMLLIGVGCLSLQGCGTPYASHVNTAPLSLCTSIPVPSAGDTNEDLARGFLEAREGLQVCQGVARTLMVP